VGVGGGRLAGEFGKMIVPSSYQIIVVSPLYPLVNKQLAIEHGPVEIVDLPIENAWWIFPSFFGMFTRG